MTDDGFDRITRAWLDAKPDRISDRALQSALAEIHLTRQRRAWWPARRIPSMHHPLRLAVAIGAVVLAVAFGTSLLGGSSVGGPRPTATPIPSPTSTPIPLALGGVGSEALSPGARYTTRDPFPFRVTFTAPAGWTGKVGGPFAAWLGPATGDDIVSFQRLENVYADPCHPEHGPLDPPLGPSVADLVDALTRLPGMTASAPIDITISGYKGTRLTLTAPSNATACTNAAFLPWTLQLGAENTMAPGTQEQLSILDVGGQRLVLVAIDPLGQSAADKAAIQTVLDSLAIESAS